jgi:hypothetical protein
LTINNTTISNSLDVAANGRTSSIPFVDQFEPRDPTTSDIQYPIQKKWLNTSTGAFWELQNFMSFNGITTANWVLIGHHAAVTETLTGNDGIIVPPTGNNINVLGDVTNILTTGNAATSTITIHLNGNVATSYVEDVGTAVPSGGILNVLGVNGITTTGSGNTITIEPTSGFLFEGNTVDAHTAPGTNPVVPNSSGLIIVTGGQIAAGSTTNVIETNSLAANTYTIEVQRSQAVASSTVGDNGVSHFNNSIFSVDSNGFVSLTTSFYMNGVFTPVLSFGGASVGITYFAQAAEFTRVGNICYFAIFIHLTSKGSSTGLASVAGLPFVCASSIGSNNVEMNINAASLPSDVFYTLGLVPTGGTNVLPVITQTPASTASTQLADTNFTNTTSFTLEGFYFIT